MSYLILIRHGETDWNRLKRFQGGRSDTPLNGRGLLQAELVANALLRDNVKAVFCSPLIRAASTAQAISARLAAPVTITESLRELDFGDYEGRFEEDLRHDYGAAFEEWRLSHYTQAPPNGESLRDAAQRVAEAARLLLAAAGNGDVAAVAHQAILMALKAYLTQDYSVEAAKAFKQDNTQVEYWDAGSRALVRRIELRGSFAGRVAG
jgi:broad specificity phosphatase PhoE